MNTYVVYLNPYGDIGNIGSYYIPLVIKAKTAVEAKKKIAYRFPSSYPTKAAQRFTTSYTDWEAVKAIVVG